MEYFLMFLNTYSNLVSRVIFPSKTIARIAMQLNIQWFSLA